MRTFTESEQRTIERVERELVSGEYFRHRARASRGVPLGGPPIRHQSYGGAMQALARFAASSDWGVAVASRAMKAVNPYVTTHEVRAQIAEAIATHVAEGYFDVIGATGPEAGRESQHKHPTTLRKAILLAVLMEEVEFGIGHGYLGQGAGVGWVLTHLIERENVTLYVTEFPAVVKHLDRA